MACFGCIPWFRRSKTNSTSSSSSQSVHPLPADQKAFQQTFRHQTYESQSSSSFHEKAQEIAQTPVSGILRTPGPVYISSPQPAQNKGPGSGASRTDDSSKLRGNSRLANVETGTAEDTLVGSPIDVVEKKGFYGHEANKSTWQGKPNGTAYDRREELTEEDEDMWARLAM